MKKVFSLFGLAFVLASCSSSVESTTTTIEESTIIESTSTIDNANPIIKIHLSNNKSITCELYPDIAPITVANFLSLIDSDYYSNTVFHRVMENFMIQTGGYELIDTTIYNKESVPTIVGEFANNGYTNDLKHTPGVLSMARATDKNSASGQFFICVAECTWLDGDYAAFGKTIDDESLANAVEISKIPTCYVSPYLTSFPTTPVSITSIERS